MNYELKYIDGQIPLIEKSRRIKLRQLSFSKILSKWNAVSKEVVEEPVAQVPDVPSDIDVNANPVHNSEIVKIPINIGDLGDKVLIVDTNWGALDTIKRRVLALTNTMYSNLSSNVSSIYKEPANTESVSTINEDEIRQTVKDAFDQIDFNNQDNVEEEVPENVNEDDIRQAVKDAFDQINFVAPEEDVVITPEEVTSTVSEENYQEPVSENNEDDQVQQKLSDVLLELDKSVAAAREANQAAPETEPTFEFESVNFDSINTDNQIEPSNDINIEINNEVNSVELDDLLKEAENLKSQKTEQDIKTENAKKLAQEKEQEKEKIKEDFLKYKTSIQAQLDESKREEEENLEKAKKAEQFTNALYSIMNQN